MKRLFIDTNIMVSAIVFDGNELEVIIKSIESGDEIFTYLHNTEPCSPKYLIGEKG